MTTKLLIPILVTTVAIGLSSSSYTSEYELYVKYYHRQPFVGFKKWLNYAKRSYCTTDPQYYQTIENTLNNFRNMRYPNRRSITKEQISVASKLSMVRLIAMHNGTLIMNKDDLWLSFLKYFEDILPSNFIMFLNLEDEPRVAPLYNYSDMKEKITSTSRPRNYLSVKDIFNSNNCFREFHNESRYSFAAFFSNEYFEQVSSHLIPIFSQSSNECFVDLLIPGSDHFKFAFRQSALLSSTLSSPYLIPWNEKSSQVMWRGSTHGVYWAPDLVVPYWRGQRQRLLETVLSLTAQNHSIVPYLNISFSRYSACFPSICQEMRKRYGEPSFLSYTEQLRYKYILDIDGTAWTGRFMPSLGYTSVIVKATYCQEFFSSFLKPYVHYIPLDREYRDFVQQVEWMMNNDASVQRIVRQANYLARTYLRIQDLKCYTSRMVLEYASLLQEDIPKTLLR